MCAARRPAARRPRPRPGARGPRGEAGPGAGRAAGGGRGPARGGSAAAAAAAGAGRGWGRGPGAPPARPQRPRPPGLSGAGGGGSGGGGGGGGGSIVRAPAARPGRSRTRRGRLLPHGPMNQPGGAAAPQVRRGAGGMHRAGDPGGPGPGALRHFIARFAKCKVPGHICGLFCGRKREGRGLESPPGRRGVRGGWG